MEKRMEYGDFVRTGSKSVLINDQPLGPAPKDHISWHKRRFFFVKMVEKPFRAKEHKHVSLMPKSCHLALLVAYSLKVCIIVSSQNKSTSFSVRNLVNSIMYKLSRRKLCDA